jgi:hypothetical protein
VSIGTGTGAVQHPRQGQAPARQPRPGKKWKQVVVGLTGVYVALACYGLIANATQLGPGTASATSSSPGTPGPAASAVSGTQQRANASGGPGPAPRAGPASRPAVQSLGVVSITAFGPEGTADGDNPGLAARILDVATDQPWYSQWYATPEFGGLRPGTGLLLDLGEIATVADVNLTLGSAPGADIQVRVGDTPTLALPAAATGHSAGGNVRLTARPRVKGRYVLIWFTRLPAIGQGRYQVSVYNVTVDGTTQP